MGHDIFISYSHNDEDAALVDRLRDDLIISGIKVWVDRHNIKLGENWSVALKRAIKESSIILVVLSPAAHKSTWIREEVELSKKYGKKIIPVLTVDGEEAARELKIDKLQLFDIRQSPPQAIVHMLKNELEKALG